MFEHTFDYRTKGTLILMRRPWLWITRVLKPLRRDENFAVPLGICEVVECRAHFVQADLASDHRGDVDLAVGQRAQ
jgi:hypothetical protein